VSLTTVELEPDGDGTLLTFNEQGAFFDGLEDPAGREHGTGALLDRLAGALER
jgi:Activator of Hsp90 ATPase homolog 1-like protein